MATDNTGNTSNADLPDRPPSSWSPPSEDNQAPEVLSRTIHLRHSISSGIFVQLDLESIEKGDHAPRSVLRSMVLYAPDHRLRAGVYSLHAYSPMLEFRKPITVHGIFPEGEKPVVLGKKDDTEEALPQAYAFSCYLPMTVRPSYIMAEVKTRMTKLAMKRIGPNSLTEQGCVPQLMFRNKHFVVHAAQGLFTLISTTSLGPRMTSVLTSM